jgi:hypothetical protein
MMKQNKRLRDILENFYEPESSQDDLNNYIEEIDEIIQNISVIVKNDQNIDNEKKFNEALVHFREAFNCLEAMNV